MSEKQLFMDWLETPKGMMCSKADILDRESNRSALIERLKTAYRAGRNAANAEIERLTQERDEYKMLFEGLRDAL